MVHYLSVLKNQTYLRTVALDALSSNFFVIANLRPFARYASALSLKMWADVGTTARNTKCCCFPVKAFRRLLFRGTFWLVQEMGLRFIDCSE